ncbi:hypothetical protein RRF57_007268 [Xylaria bambusicola]|uniref:N-acetyltransferase domain-containing protein n=1 Tax=Xylaria bambusicola TaxID=326684 RepID=A0AAN7UQA1_9PEZI
MASPNPTPPKIRIKTTGPVVPPNIDRPPILTERLLLRQLDISDAEAVHALRTQPEVMQWTSVGTVDKDVDESRAWIKRFLPPKDLLTYNFVIVDRGDATTAIQPVNSSASEALTTHAMARDGLKLVTCCARSIGAKA